MPRWQWILTQVMRRLWVRATLIGMLGVVMAILAAVAERFIPWELPGNIGANAVDSILNIIASSMLAVTTFSLSVMTSAYGSATSNVTPRATKLLMEDRVTQNVLSTFLGSFLFGIVGIIVLKTGAYGDRGRVILFVVTVGVVVLIVVTLLRWIDHLTRLGRVGETTDRVEEATRQAIQSRLDQPYLGGVPRLVDLELPASAIPVTGEAVGYVQHIDMAALSRCCEDNDAQIYVAILPGGFAYPEETLAWIHSRGRGSKDAEAARKIVRDAFSINAERSFDQDPRFGLAVMSEIGSRALSPAVNDPGTAIDVIGRMVRLMNLWATGSSKKPEEEVIHPHVHVPSLQIEDMFEDAFVPISRDGASLIEVQLRLRKALLALAKIGDESFRCAALRQAELAQQRAQNALTFEEDRTRLKSIEQDMGGQVSHR